MRKRKLLSALTALSLLATVVPSTPSFAETAPPVTTVQKISLQYGVTPAFLQDELNKGFSIQEIQTALAASKVSDSTYAQLISTIKPSFTNDSTTRTNQVQSEVVKPTSISNAIQNTGKKDQTLLAPDSTTESTSLTADPTLPAINVDESPYKISMNQEEVSTLSGGLSVHATDLYLPGRNGLDFNLSRSYDSGDSQFYKTSMRDITGNEGQMKFNATTSIQARGYQVRWNSHKDIELDVDGDGKPDQRKNLSISRKNESSSTIVFTQPELTALIDQVKNQGSKAESWAVSTESGYKSWRYVWVVEPETILSYSTDQTKTISQTTEVAYTKEGYRDYSTYFDYIKQNVGQDYYRTAWDQDPSSTYLSTRTVRAYADTPTLETEDTLYTGTYKSVSTYDKSNSSSAYLAAGWSWNIPRLEITGSPGPVYLHMGNGSVYRPMSYSDFYDYPWQDMDLDYDRTVNVNGMQSDRVLFLNKEKKKYYFSFNKLIQIKDFYGNTINFSYMTDSNSKSRIAKIQNNIGNSIDFTYDQQTITVTQGSKKVIYNKSWVHPTGIDDQHNVELLTSATDHTGRKTTYDYEIRNADFNLQGTKPTTSNPYALLSGVTYPTGAKKSYHYEDAPVVRYTDANAVNQAYRVKSVENQVVYSDGFVDSVARYNFTYTGDMGVKQQDYDNNYFSTTVDNGRTKTTFDYKRNYFNYVISPGYYNTKITESSGDQQTVTTMSYIEKVGNSSPSTSTTQVTKGGVTSPAITSSYTYDDYGNVLTETNPLGVTTTHTYGGFWNPLLLSTSQPISSTQTKITNYTRNTNGSVTKIEIKDQSDNIYSTTDMEYDAYGNNTLAKVTDDNNQIIQAQVTYDPTKQRAFPSQYTLSKVGGTAAVTKKYEYDLTTGNMTKYIDGNGNATSYQYDALDRLSKITYPDLTTMSALYNDQKNEIEQVDENGLRTLQRWNPLGLKVETGLYENGIYKSKTKNGYDRYGRNTWSEDAVGNRTSFDYDNFDRLASTVNVDGTRSTVQYDDINNTRTSTNEDGTSIRESYDKLGRTLKQEQLKTPSNLTLSTMTYDNLNNLLTKTDANGASNLTQYTYDVLGQLKSVLDAEGNTTKYDYNKLGALSLVTYPDGKTTKKEYDEFSRLLKQTDALGQISTYTYDGEGNVATQLDRNGSLTKFTYDNRNRLLRKQNGTNVIDYALDPTGKRKKMTDQTGATLYAYTSTGQLASVQTPDGKTMTYTYDENGHRSKMKDPFDRETFYQYESRNRLASLSLGSETASAEASYTYSNGGQMKSISQQNGMRTDFTYDDSNRLVGLQQKKPDGSIQNTFNYQYDANGNQTSKTEKANLYTFTYDKLNRIKTNTQFNESYTYDKRDNRETSTTDQPFQLNNSAYEYDVWNQLTKVTNADGKVVTYRYNGDGLMVERTENSVTTRYYYDGSDIIAEAQVTSGQPVFKARYLRGSAGQLVAREDTNNTKAYYSHNGHGDVTELRDSLGNVLNSYTYDVWGKPITTDEKVSNPFRYSGEYWDSTTELQYLRARWYDPGVGRFINEDTYEGDITNSLSLNLYTYVKNNPLRYTDPSGHIPSVSEAAEMAKNIYSVTLDNRGAKLSGGWQLDNILSNDEGLKMGVYSRVKANGTTEYSLVNKGTDSGGDWIDNIQQPVGLSDDMHDSIVKSDYFVFTHKGYEITMVGHSKGGAEAIANAVANNKNAITFNTAIPNLSIYGLTDEERNYTAAMTHYVVKGEILNSTFGEPSIGNVVYLPQQYETKWWYGAWFNLSQSIKNHSMDSVSSALEEAGYN